MSRRNLIAACVATSMVLVAGVAATASLISLGPGESASGSADPATTSTVTVVRVEYVDEVVTEPPPGVVIPPEWPAGTPYPPLPADCLDARLELTGVWTCDD